MWKKTQKERKKHYLKNLLIQIYVSRFNSQCDTKPGFWSLFIGNHYFLLFFRKFFRKLYYTIMKILWKILT